VSGAELDKEVRRELLGLAAHTAKDVSRHLVMAGRLIDDDPEQAWAHACAARDLAGRVSVVREAAGLTAYRSGRYAEALAELRTARRVSGSNVHLPIMADCERGLGRPERALAVATSAEANLLDEGGRIEMRIVAAGARLDLGQPEAAVLTLQIAELTRRPAMPWQARLRAAYSDALAAAGRHEEAQQWLQRAAEVDETGETGAADRLDPDSLELSSGWTDLLDDEDDEDDEVGLAADAGSGAEVELDLGALRGAAATFLAPESIDLGSEDEQAEAGQAEAGQDEAGQDEDGDDNEEVDGGDEVEHAP
jgi:tetratricopeptide (TPR) repeat protein